MKDYYKILGISKNATKSEIQKAYRILAKKYHPDANNGDEECKKLFLDVNEAYKILKDEDKREEYDARLNKSEKQKASNKANTEKTKGNESYENRNFDFSSVHNSFESFFGFNAKTGEVTNESKLKNKNPIDTSDLFEKFMGFKK